MASSCHQSSPVQTLASGYILAKTAKSGIFYFFTGVFTTVNTETGDLLVGETGLFPGDAFLYESRLTAQRIANQLNRAGIGSHWHAVPASTPFEIPFAPIAHPGLRETAPPAA
ncbi:hypothetical protein BKI51_18805 [Alphaproteobacteria bacterium AO1-B]|nr:hypothetical protein BKI51_18805 [Alphaproteobacteria bacterium AO1-B]